MAIKKVTFMFECGNSGFTESFYLPDNVTSEAAMTAAKNIVPTRAALLGSGARLARIRVSDVGTGRDAKVYTTVSPEGTGPLLSALPGFNALLLTLLNSNNTPAPNGNLFMRGIPTNLQTSGGELVRAADFWGSLRKWITSMTGPVGWGYRTKLVPGAHQWNIDGVSQDCDTGMVSIRILGDMTALIPAGDVKTINIRRVGGSKHLRGRHVFKSATVSQGPPVVTFINYYSCKDVLNYTSGGILEFVGSQYQKITGIEPGRITERKVGRVFGLPVGRQRAC